MNNIDKLKKMMELSRLKAELHKHKAMSYFPWNEKNENHETVNKVMQYGEVGYSIFKLVQDLSKNNQNQTQEA